MPNTHFLEDSEEKIEVRKKLWRNISPNYKMKRQIKYCKIGDGTKIWHYVNLYGCTIGKNCCIGSFVEIQPSVKIGDNVTISSHSFICSLVTIEDDVFIGHGVMTINDLYPPSKRVTRSDNNWESILIKKGAVIGSNATLLPVIIGEYAIIGAGACVTKNTDPYGIYIGNPTKKIGDRRDEKYKNEKNK